MERPATYLNSIEDADTVRKGAKVVKVRDKASLPNRYSPAGSTSGSLTEYRTAAPLASRKELSAVGGMTWMNGSMRKIKAKLCGRERKFLAWHKFGEILPFSQHASCPLDGLVCQRIS